MVNVLVSACLGVLGVLGVLGDDGFEFLDGPCEVGTLRTAYAELCLDKCVDKGSSSWECNVRLPSFSAALQGIKTKDVPCPATGITAPNHVEGKWIRCFDRQNNVVTGACKFASHTGQACSNIPEYIYTITNGFLTPKWVCRDTSVWSWLFKIGVDSGPAPCAMNGTHFAYSRDCARLYDLGCDSVSF
ncbi:protein ORF117 [Anguillid herpesvirus 1]|uniref:Protein ORF117 n=1 Tax=Anguillid herpesvirus 1 TaxID=150286 RepID=A0A8E5ANH7_9VIRU|nr:protein ORF117 [Anguillid herpesvirus 1]QRM16802.1 protein ORF117 [Anguillid herpesvirus 1]QRM16932.1 protein ORF117 [Anguillid herpesvirus 1]QRM17193.1 protein ORF117 [Anguillid herpesvirus 1]UWI83691.1 protein ORF117 [Anguillid herpesvirus 1]